MSNSRPPQAGDIWEVKVPGKPKITKEIRYIWDKWMGEYPNLRQEPYVDWRHLPKGRYSGITVENLLKYGKLISTKEERKAQEKQWWIDQEKRRPFPRRAV